MKSIFTTFLSLLLINSYAQYCTSGIGPTSDADSDLGDITLNGETQNISIPATCLGTLGLEDLTGSQSADLIADSSYSISVDFNTCGGNYGNAGEIWIDYDRDQLFETNESIGMWSGTAPSGVQTYNFTVPSWVCNGSTRIRIMQEEGGTNPLDPCSSFTWGAIIDASITLSGGACSPPPVVLCTSVGPSSSADSDLGAISLNGTTQNINIPASCPGIIGREDLTSSQFADLSATSSYTLSVDFNTCGGNYSNSGEIWIDYNINNTFESNESIGSWSGTAPSGVQNYNFTVPTWVCNDTTIIRVMQEEGGSLPLDPCATFTWGAVIDASIILSGGLCQTPGCTDSLSLNYNPLATIDDGSCQPIDGINCDTPSVIPSLPFNQAGLSTALYGNDYSSADACNSSFMDGNDYVFEYSTATAECISAVISNASFSAGLFILDACPDAGANCLAQGTGNNALASAVLSPGTYYIVVSTDPSFGGPMSTNFDISITSTTTGGVGSSCVNSHLITGSYSQAGMTNSCYGNNYSSADACGSIFMNGEDYVFEYVPQNDTCVEISISNASFNTGAFLIQNCPDASNAQCLGFSTGSDFNFSANVDADSTYYIVISTDGFPSTTGFDIDIQEYSCAVPDSQDCEGAVLICQDYYEPDYWPGDGNIPNEVPSSSCLGTGEKNAIWYQFTSYQNGVLGFTIFPNDPNDDYDWAVYDITDFGCNGVPTGLSPELSCDYAPNVCPPPGGDGSTGPNGDLTGPCAGQNQPLIPVDSGSTYVIVVSQFTDASQDGFTISFDTNGVISANSIDAEDQTINCGETAILESNFEGPLDSLTVYDWAPAGSLNNPSLENPTTVPLDTTTDFLVSVQNGQCILSDTLTVEVIYNGTSEPVELTLNCGDTLSLDVDYDPYTDSVRYVWSPGNYLIDSTSENPLTNPLDSSITFNVLIYDGICINSDTVDITIEYPDVVQLPNDTSLCFGQEIEIKPILDSSIENRPINYYWSPNSYISNINDSVPVFTAHDSITYILLLQHSVCYEYDTITINSLDSLAAIADYYINENFNIDGVAEVEFYNASIGTSLTHDWSFGDGETSSELEEFHIYKNEGTYNVSLYVTDELGCMDSTFLTVPIPLIELPNIFTPNGDLINDEFFINRLRPLSILRVYNRWGKMVYESQDYDNKWDGGDLEDGTYYAELSYVSNQRIKTYTGWFTITR